MSRHHDEITTRSIPQPPTIDVRKKLPINLLRKAIRERRNAGIAPTKLRRRKKLRQNKQTQGSVQHEAIVRSTEAEIRRILATTNVLPDIPYDYTETELLGEIAFAQGVATTIYIQRDGLSTLNILLPQANPTIANLKRAIESVSRAQLRRELRERFEERQQRRRQHQYHERQHAMEYTTSSKSGSITTADSNSTLVKPVVAETETLTTANTSTTMATNVSLAHIKSTGELVYSTACSGHQHRTNVSWRFLWRAYALFDLNTKTPLDDQCGSKLLSEYGIKNGSTLKFCNREKYFGRKRQ